MSDTVTIRSGDGATLDGVEAKAVVVEQLARALEVIEPTQSGAHCHARR